MPIQPENKIFPHVIPAAPESEEFHPDTLKDLVRWAKETTLALNDLNRQIVDKYNGHISGTHNHPGSWSALRVPRPRYYNHTDASTSLKIPASSSQPARFVIDGELYEVTSELTVSELDTGSLAAGTIYYIYGVRTGSTVKGILSTSDPSTGPSGYSVSTYLGACATKTSEATFPGFGASGGHYMSAQAIGTEQSLTTTTGAYVEKTVLLPTTARFGFFRIYINGTTASAYGAISANPTSGSSLYQELQVSGVIVYAYGWVPINVPQTIWLYLQSGGGANTVYASPRGWREDPTEWP